MRQNQRRRLIPETIEQWQSRGIPASAVSDDQQEELLERIVGWSWSQMEQVGDLSLTLHDFTTASSMVTVVAWQARERPAVLVPAYALVRTEEDLRRIYPDGFMTFTEAATLIIDFDEAPGDVRALRLPAA
ncbi:hypothetical protein [Phenylobacterium sp.]|jgi:hypothetical protein|uniref:hypothetical protein n=1 Tax=Phenylobacterium sp. TaxID=1871053 RepID=UPI002F94AA35